MRSVIDFDCDGEPESGNRPESNGVFHAPMYLKASRSPTSGRFPVDKPLRIGQDSSE
ncbi:hypothetical protein [Burkholderia glumae]|uniref:hypothetical protein n=1 Tax=Burkholderia glumae TaxID=337 RepID=UPI000AB65D5E|nr:hypothetical protein [Burkholderia glumae]